jgi:hypothetical protein
MLTAEDTRAAFDADGWAPVAVRDLFRNFTFWVHRDSEGA